MTPRAVVLTLGFALLILLGRGAAAQNPPAAVSPADPAATRIKELQAEADRLARDSGTLLNELRQLELARQIRIQELRAAEAEVARLEREQTVVAARVAALEAERQAATPLVAERLVEIYKRGRGGYLPLLLGAGDLKQLGRLSRGVASVARLDRLRIDAHRRTIRAERDASAALEARRAEAVRARDAAAAARRAVDAAVAAHNRRMDDIDTRRDLAAQYVGELQAAQRSLQDRVAATPERAAALPIQPFRGALDWPANGSLLTRFGRGTSDRLGAAIVRNGIEIATTEAQQIRAVHGGTVSYAAPFTGFGTLVILDHGGNAFSLYGHLSQALVTEGRAVERGAVIGRAGRSPAGVHSLYFELRVDGRPVDPVQWFRSPR